MTLDRDQLWQRVLVECKVKFTFESNSAGDGEHTSPKITISPDDFLRVIQGLLPGHELLKIPK